MEARPLREHELLDSVISPGAADSMRKSAFSTRRKRAARPSSPDRSSVIPRLLRLKAKKLRLRSGFGPSSRKGLIRRLDEPWGGSILMTSAPKSPRIMLASSPRSFVRSRTV